MAILNKLTAKEIDSPSPKTGKSIRKSDGGGLYLHIKPSGAKCWEFRYTRPLTKKPTFMGIGSYCQQQLKSDPLFHNYGNRKVIH